MLSDCATLFQECLLGLLKSKTVIYITHQVEFLPNADLILVSDSRISWSRIQTTAFRQFTILLVSDFELEKNVENTNDQTDKSNDTVVEPKGQLVQEEEREKGRVGFKVYWKYIITAYVGTLVPFILLQSKGWISDWIFYLLSHLPAVWFS